MKPEESNMIRQIARLMTETDVDVIWDINNISPKELWVQAFWEGANYATEVYDEAIKKATTKEVKNG